MSDVFTRAKRSEVMSQIRSRGNRDTEPALAKLFRLHRITGWRRQVEGRSEKVEGRRKSARTSHLRLRPFTVHPDFVFPKLRLAIFVDGCFWHGCPKHATWPAQRATWWRRKISGNQARDWIVNRALRRAGWRVLRIWEHELPRLKAERRRLKAEGWRLKHEPNRVLQLPRLKAEGQRPKGKQSRVLQQIQRALAG